MTPPRAPARATPAVIWAPKVDPATPGTTVEIWVTEPVAVADQGEGGRGGGGTGDREATAVESITTSPRPSTATWTLPAPVTEDRVLDGGERRRRRTRRPLSPGLEDRRLRARPGAALATAWSGRWRYGVAGSLVGYVDQVRGRPVVRAMLADTTNTALLRRVGLTEPQLLERWRAATGAR